MSSGMCKICTHLFSVQLTFIKNIIDVASYNSSVFLKQLSHMSLRQPHRLILQADINLRLSVLRHDFPKQIRALSSVSSSSVSSWL